MDFWMMSDAQRQRAAVEHGRQLAADRQAELDAARAEREAIMAKNRKTKYGLVEKLPDVGRLDESLDHLHASLIDALDAAEAAEKRERSLAQTTPVDRERFTALDAPATPSTKRGR